MLLADEPATTHFRLAGQTHITAGGADSSVWQVYTGLISADVDTNSTASFDYRPVNRAGDDRKTGIALR
jgi:hypothetical protein